MAQETVTVSGRFAANEMQAVIAAAIAGYGIAQLPYRLAEASIKDGRLRRVLDDLHDAGWRPLCRISEQPTPFALGQGIHRACGQAR